MTDRELLKETLKILDKAKWVLTQSSNEKPQKVMFQFQSKDWFEMTTKINNRLAQPEPEPVKEWEGLTEEECEAIEEKCVINCYFDTLKYAKAIETKLKEKNT